MINKQGLWFITLFSLIIVLGIYYFAAGQTSLSIASLKSSKSYVANTSAENDAISVLKVSENESKTEKIDELQTILLDEKATLEEKNDAYDELEVISKNLSEENKIVELIKKEFKLRSFVKINGNEINVTISSNVHNNELANEIMRKVQSIYEENKFVTVKFNS